MTTAPAPRLTVKATPNARFRRSTLFLQSRFNRGARRARREYLSALSAFSAVRVSLELEPRAQQAASRIDDRQHLPVGFLRAVVAEVRRCRGVGHVDQIPREPQPAVAAEIEVLVEAESKVVRSRQQKSASRFGQHVSRALFQ